MFSADPRLFELSMSEQAQPLLNAVKKHIRDNVEPITEEFFALDEEKKDRWSWHPRQLELLEGAKNKAKQAGLLARAQTANARFAVREHLYDGRVDNAVARFDQVERKLDELEGRVEAFDVGGDGNTLANEIASLEASSKIDDDLAENAGGGDD